MDFDRFIETLIEEKGLGREEPEVVTQLKEDLAGRLEDRVNAMILSVLSDEDLDGFEAAIDTGDVTKAQEFLRTHISDFDQKVAAELVAFKVSYLGG